MAMDVTDHVAVPDHRIMDEDEIDELLEKFDAEKDDLPEIQRTDAALKQTDAEVGDVVEIQRESPTAGKTTYYRRVVEAK
jgi:DNA-directed RNA polymerase subunit H